MTDPERLSQLSELESSLGVRFKELSLLEEALTHSSFSHENPGVPANERLEFLGDAVLGFVMAEMLHSLTPPLSEGEMSWLRSHLVCRDTLASIARSVGLGNYLRLGKGEEASGGRRRASILARALEAILGAIFEDQGLESARAVIDRLFKKEWQRVLNGEIPPNYKSELQQVLQRQNMPPPRYRIVNEIGPDHAKSFVVEVVVGDRVIGRGVGKSKKKAENAAARDALFALELRE